MSGRLNILKDIARVSRVASFVGKTKVSRVASSQVTSR
jgi:hypothetical protein